MKSTLVHIIKHSPVMIQKLFCHIILLADSKPTFLEKLKYFWLIISTTAPVLWLIELIFKFYSGLSRWYVLNMQFADFVLLAIICNLLIGVWYHLRMKTFKIESFLIKNFIMIAVLILGYMMLEMLHVTLGENVLAEGFKVVIQIATLLYPSSKAMKNLYILSNKQFPPGFIMERLYNFEKSGNLKDLFPDEPNKE